MFYLVSLLVNVVLASPVTVIVCPYHAPCSLVSIDVHQCHLHLCNYVFYVKLLVFVPQCLFVLLTFGSVSIVICR